MWELKPWVNASKLNIRQLHLNQNAFDYLLLYHLDNIKWNLLFINGSDDAMIMMSDKNIHWTYLSCNRSITAFHKLKKNKDKIKWYNLLWNPHAIDYILEHFDEITQLCFINSLSKNPHPKAIELLSKNPHHIKWYYLSKNPSAMELLMKYPNNIFWDGLSCNPSAIDLLLENPHKIDWYNFCKNPHPKAIKFLKEHPECIDWYSLCDNPSAEELFILYPEKIIWSYLSSNPCIFQYNYKECRTVFRTTLFKEELIASALHPDRIDHYLKMGYTLSDF